MSILYPITTCQTRFSCLACRLDIAIQKTQDITKLPWQDRLVEQTKSLCTAYKVLLVLVLSVT